MNDNLRTSLEGGESGEEEIRPDFLKKNEGKGAAVLGAAEQAASAVVAAKTGGAGAGAKGTKAGAKTPDGKKDAGGAVSKGFYKSASENGQTSKNEAKLNLPNGLKAAGPFLIILLAIVGIVGLIVALPVMMIGALDYNLQKVLGFTETIGILEKQGEYVTAELAKSGEMPSEYASSLASNGVMVGQVGTDGNFYQTNVYVANIAEKNDLIAAAGGFSYVSDEEGELALLYNGEVIRADDFVAKVESTPELYAAYSAAADLSTKYYYGDDVEEVYQEMGLSRGNFNSWETTGDYTADHEKFTEILNKTLNNGSNIVVGGAYDDVDEDGARMEDEDAASVCADATDGGTYCREVSDKEASAVSSGVSENTREYIYKWWPHKETIDGVEKIVWTPQYSENSTERAAELLNTAVSSGEPYLASSAFIAVEEAVQRARVNGDGPVNHVMNTLTEGTSVSYQNVSTGATETTNLSILETQNFRAAVSDSNYSKEEAYNFGRDRIMQTTGLKDSIKGKDVIRRTTVGAAGRENSNSVVRNGKTGEEAESEIVNKANENIELSQANNNSDTFQSVIGGNRIIEGGSFLSNTINMHTIGAMPSNAETIAAYHAEVEEVLARKAEAERATKNPFDVSSPNTFFGTIVHNFASSMLGTVGSSNTASSAFGSVLNTFSKALKTITGTAKADSYNDEYTTMSGLGCETVQSAGGIEGDLYCTSHNTVSTKYMNYTKDTWESKIDEDGYKDFTLLGMDRYATVGVKNAEVCEKHNNMHGGGGIGSIVRNFFKQMMGTYEVCEIKTDDDDNITDEGELAKLKIYTGAKYSFGADGTEENELYSGYAMYQEVRKLLSGEETTTAKIRKEYYNMFPKDDSAAGVIARRSGLTREEVEIAMNYSDYLNVIASYDAKDRHSFGKTKLNVEKSILETFDDGLSENLYAFYQKQTEYEDLRTRNFVI